MQRVPRVPGVHYRALTPNQKGLEAADLVVHIGSSRLVRGNQFWNRFWLSRAAVTHAIGAYSPPLSRYGFRIETAGGNQDKVFTDRQFTPDVA